MRHVQQDVRWRLFDCTLSLVGELIGKLKTIRRAIEEDMMAAAVLILKQNMRDHQRAARHKRALSLEQLRDSALFLTQAILIHRR